MQKYVAVKWMERIIHRSVYKWLSHQENKRKKKMFKESNRQKVINLFRINIYIAYVNWRIDMMANLFFFYKIHILWRFNECEKIQFILKIRIK